MENLLPTLSRTALFADLSPQEIRLALEGMPVHTKHYTKESPILSAGQPTTSLGILLSGSAMVSQDDIWGNRNIITRLSAGDLFAEPFALLGNIPLNINVFAQQDCQVLWLPVSAFMPEGDTTSPCHNRMAQNLMTTLARKLLVFNEKVTHISHRKTRDKLLSYLSAQAIRQGSLSFTIPFNRQQLADYLCIDRAAMSVELSRLQSEGILETNRSTFTLKKPGEC